MRIPFACAASTLLSASVALAASSPSAIPSPRPAGWVVDQARLLSADDVATLHALGEQVRQRDGAELAVLTIPSTDGMDHRRYATEVFNHWELGMRARNNGLLLFVAINDRAAEIILGAGIDSDAQVAGSDRIMQQIIVPRFRSGDHDGAIVEGARACAAEFFGIVPPPLEAPAGAIAPGSMPATRAKRAPDVVTYLGPAAGLGALGTVAWIVTRAVARRRPRRCRQCAMTMVRLDETADDAHLGATERTEEKVGSVDYDVWQCPGCGSVEKLRYGRWFTRYSKCPQCGGATKSSAQRTLRSATTMSTGLVEVHEKCAHCAFQNTYTRTTPRISRSSSSSSSGRSSGGGGRSSGRGSSGRW